MEKPLDWKICRKARCRFHIQLVEDPDLGIVGAYVRRPPDYEMAVYYAKGTRSFWRFRQMYQVSLEFLDQSSMAA